MRLAYLGLGALSVLLLAASCHTTGAVEVEEPERPLVVVETDETPPPPEPPDQTPPTVNASTPEIPEGVLELHPHCTRGVPDRPNALDDNCNGQVDEADVQSGSIQITLGWETGADIDLFVVDPFHQELSEHNTTVDSGGVMDRSARGACTNGQTNENVYWPAGDPPRGEYLISAHYRDECQAASGSTRLTLSVMAGGRALGVYRYDIALDERIDLATFTVQEPAAVEPPAEEPPAEEPPAETPPEAPAQ